MHRIKTGWLKWRHASVSGVLFDLKIPFELKGKFYRIMGANVRRLWKKNIKK